MRSCCGSGTLLLADPFVVARIIAVVSAGLSLRVAHALARDLFGPGPALAAQVFLALNWHFHETALLVGTDQLASLVALLAVRALAASMRDTTVPRAIVGGAWAGAAALVRQTALVLLPVFVLATLWSAVRGHGGRRRWLLAAVTVGAGLAVYAPQMAISWRATGTPFHQTQARNVWFGLHGAMDWSRSPGERELSLIGIVRDDPRLFFTHWASETVLGGIRLAAMTVGQFPPWLARRVGGIVPVACGCLTGLAVLATLASLRPRRLRGLARQIALPGGVALFLILLVGGWTAAVGLAFSTSRFLLTPWIVCAIVGVALFRSICLPEDGRRDRRAALAQGAWLLDAAGPRRLRDLVHVPAGRLTRRIQPRLFEGRRVRPGSGLFLTATATGAISVRAMAGAVCDRGLPARGAQVGKSRTGSMISSAIYSSGILAAGRFAGRADREGRAAEFDHPPGTTEGGGPGKCRLGLLVSIAAT